MRSLQTTNFLYKQQIDYQYGPRCRVETFLLGRRIISTLPTTNLLVRLQMRNHCRRHAGRPTSPIHFLTNLFLESTTAAVESFICKKTNTENRRQFA